MKKANSVPDLETLFSIPQVRDYALSPDGNAISFITNPTGQWQLYVARLGRETLSNIRQVTSGQEGVLHGDFSPNSKSLLFARDFQGDEKCDLYLTDLESGNERILTPGTNFMINPEASISKNGKKVVFVSNESGEFATYVLELDENNKTMRMTNHNFSDNFAIFSPDNRSIAISSSVSGQDNGLFLAYGDGEVKRIQDANGKPIEASQPEWSQDGRRITFVSSSRGFYDVAVWHKETEEIEWLTDSDHEYNEPEFSHDGRKIVYTMNSGGDIKLIVHDLASKEKRVLELRHGVALSPKFSIDDKSIFSLFSGSKNPLDVWKYELEDGSAIQMTDSVPHGVDLSNFVDGGTEVRYISRKDSLQVPALLTLPNHYEMKDRRKRAVILIHGGPTSQSLNSWHPLVQILVTNGIAVLEPNYRGSTRYGRKFREANRFCMGDLDLADCVAGYDYLLREGIASSDRVAVAGASFGGYLTMCALVKYQDLWACGSALVPFLNWFTEMANERDDLRYWDRENMGDPEKDAERLREASPIFFLDRLKAPVQIIGGANDPRCPPKEEAGLVRDELRKLGREVDFKIYDDEGHGFRKTSNRVDAYKRIVSFILKHL